MVEGKMAQRRVRAVVLQHLCENLTPLFVDTAHLRCASFLCQMDASFEVSFAPSLDSQLAPPLAPFLSLCYFVPLPLGLFCLLAGWW
jgi:hypothetical protein